MIGDRNGKVLFSDDELRCNVSGLLKLDYRFVSDLRHLRLMYGAPMIVTSCCRSSTHNGEVGGHPRSLHICDEPAYAGDGQTGTMAIDIKRPAGDMLHALVATATDEGWSVGIADSFVHLDVRYNLGMEPVVFTYPSGAKR